MSEVENFSLGLEQIVVIVKLHVLAIDLLLQSSRHISWNSRDIFYPLNVGFCELVSQKRKIIQEGRSTTFSWNMGAAQGVPT